MTATRNASGPATALSMRAFLDALEHAGELVTVDRLVDWDLEMGAIARRCYETGAPAPLFTNVRDARHGFRAIGAPVAHHRQHARRERAQFGRQRLVFQEKSDNPAHQAFPFAACLAAFLASAFSRILGA